MYKFPFSAPKDRHIHNTFIPYIHLTFILHLLFLRPFFVFSSSFLRSSFVFCSSFLRLFIICPCGSHRLLFVSLFRYYTPSPKERDGERIFYSSFHHLPVRLAPSFVRLTFPLLHSLSQGEGWGEDIFFILPPLIHHRYPTVDPL